MRCVRLVAQTNEPFARGFEESVNEAPEVTSPARNIQSPGERRPDDDGCLAAVAAMADEGTSA